MAEGASGAGDIVWGFSAIREAVDTVLSRSGDMETRVADVELLALSNYLLTSLLGMGQSLGAHAVAHLAAGDAAAAARCSALASRFSVAAVAGVQEIYTGSAGLPPAAAALRLAERLPALLDRLMAIWNELGAV